MKSKLVVVVASLCLAATIAAQNPKRVHAATDLQSHITREVRHELIMLPNFSVFDNITYKVEGSTVVLRSEVLHPSIKSEAEKAMMQIEGVSKLDNGIKILPPSSTDDHIRMDEFRAIYQCPGLQKYELSVQKPIRIIVKNGHVTLDRVVDTEPDQNLAGVRARSVSGVLSVTNNLQVAEPRSSG